MLFGFARTIYRTSGDNADRVDISGVPVRFCRRSLANYSHQVSGASWFNAETLRHQPFQIGFGTIFGQFWDQFAIILGPFYPQKKTRRWENRALGAKLLPYEYGLQP